jgi:hypothetical protein
VVDKVPVLVEVPDWLDVVDRVPVLVDVFE